MDVIVFDGPSGPVLLYPIIGAEETLTEAIAREMALLADANTAAFVVDRDSLPTDPQEWWVVDYDASTIGVAPPLPPVPETISDRQFAQGLAKQGLITIAEALAWVGPGTLPAAMVAFLDGLSADERFDAEIVLTGATEFRRSHPLTDAFGQVTGMDSAALDDFWRFCAAL